MARINPARWPSKSKRPRRFSTELVRAGTPGIRRCRDMAASPLAASIITSSVSGQGSLSSEQVDCTLKPGAVRLDDGKHQSSSLANDSPFFSADFHNRQVASLQFRAANNSRSGFRTPTISWNLKPPPPAYYRICHEKHNIFHGHVAGADTYTRHGRDREWVSFLYMYNTSCLERPRHGRNLNSMINIVSSCSCSHASHTERRPDGHLEGSSYLRAEAANADEMA